VAVTYHGKKFPNIGLGGKLKYRGNLPFYRSNLPWYVNPGKCKYCGIFITLAQGVDVIRPFSWSLMVRPIKPDIFQASPKFFDLGKIFTKL
jgi:hypothetical protein